MAANNMMLDKYWKNGGKWDSWAYHQVMVKDFISKNDLKPLDDKTSAAYRLDLGVEMASTPTMRTMKNSGELNAELYWEAVQGIKGGMRVPHLHFRGDIYMLNNEKWKMFSGMMMDSLREKLNNANSISFESMMELAQTVDTTLT